MTKYIGPKTDGENVATQADVGGSALSDATPDALTPDQAGAAGTAESAARADHAHQILCEAAGAILPDASAAEGSATTFARSDHTHSITTAAPATTLSASTTNAEGNATSFARSNHTHAISIGTPGAIQPDDSASAGSASSLARSDHQHSIAAAAPSSDLTASTTNAEGTSTSFARADHSHAIAAASAGTITGTNAEGSSTSFARADHDHAYGAGSIPQSALALGPTYETSLPGSPVDGQEIYYAADATNSIIWHLRYRSAARSGSGAWEFVGGSNLHSGPAGNRSTTSTTYTTLTSGPSLTIPRQGKYQITYGCETQLTGSGSSADVEIGLAEAATVVYAMYVALIDRFERQSPSETVIEDVATSAALDLRIRNNQGVSVTFAEGYISARPVFIY